MSNNHIQNELQLLSPAELSQRLKRVTDAMAAADVDALLISDNANIFYLTGRVFNGCIWVDAGGRVMYFVRRPSVLRGDGIVHIRKPEDISAYIPTAQKHIGLMGDDISYAAYERLSIMLGCRVSNCSGLLRQARAVKTPGELALIEQSGMRQTEVYRAIPGVFRPGMSDIEFQIEIERLLRLKGCLGQFRVSGTELEIYMGNVLTGANADTPSPYDFAMGGAGVSPSLPVGADGTLIRPGQVVMVDMNGNFNGYMTDMTRCYAQGEAAPRVQEANDVSRRICSEVSSAARPGTPCRDLYALAHDIATQAGLADYFMGHTHHAGFVGHGVGITINEGPVIAPRSRDTIAAGNVIALEPKFVIPGHGAVGIENTYAVAEQTRRLTTAPEEIISL